MATYEELAGEDEDLGARLRGGFRFPAPVAARRAPPDVSRPEPSVQAMLEVLRPQAVAAIGARRVEPKPFEKGSYQNTLVERAAYELREIRIAGKTRVPYNPDNPEPFWDACAQTAQAALEAENAIEDEEEAAIACAMFKLAGFYSGGIHLLNLQAQVQAQMFVIEKARQVRFLFAKQQDLAWATSPVDR